MAHTHVLGSGGKDRNPYLLATYGMSLDCVIHRVSYCTFHGNTARSLESGGIDYTQDFQKGAKHGKTVLKDRTSETIYKKYNNRGETESLCLAR